MYNANIFHAPTLNALIHEEYRKLIQQGQTVHRSKSIEENIKRQTNLQIEKDRQEK